MAVLLSEIPDTQESDPLTIVEAVKRAGDKPRLGVATTTAGEYHLCAERTRGKLGKDGKRSRDNGTELFWKRTSALRDVYDALNSGLCKV